MISENAAAENQGPGIFFLIWILLFWEKGESLVSLKKLLLSHSVKTFCMSTPRATTFSVSCSWHRNVTMAKETLLLPPGNVPENIGKRAEKGLSVCWGRNIILGVRTPWASSLAAPGWAQLCEAPWFFQRIHSHPHYPTPFPRKVQLA